MHGAFKLIQLASGQLFGDDDVIGARNRLATATCISHSAKVYKIEACQFFSRIESIEETKVEVRLQLYQKENQMK